MIPIYLLSFPLFSFILQFPKGSLKHCENLNEAAGLEEDILLSTMKTKEHLALKSHN